MQLLPGKHHAVSKKAQIALWAYDVQCPLGEVHITRCDVYCAVHGTYTPNSETLQMRLGPAAGHLQR